MNTIEPEYWFGYKSRCNELKDKKTFIESKYDVYKKYTKYEYFKDIMPEDAFKAILRLKRSRYGKRYRANKKVAKMSKWMANTDYKYTERKVVFVTCNLDDRQFYNKNGKPIKEITRRLKVNKWIKEHFEYAVVNIDYGEKNGREHYHFVGITNNKVEYIPIMHKGKQVKSKKGFPLYNIKDDDYDLGFLPTIEIVDTNNEDEKLKRISNYMLKINNHSNKPSTKNHRIRIIKSKDYELNELMQIDSFKKAMQLVENTELIELIN